MRISAAEAMRRVDEIARLTLNDAQHAITKAAVLEAANSAIPDRLTRVGTYGAAAYNAVRNALIADLVLTVCRLFDPAKRRRRALNSTEVASIPEMLRFARQKRCRDRMIERARSWNDPSMSDVNAALVVRALDEAIDVYDDYVRSWSGKRVLSLLRQMRDWEVAHSLHSRPPEFLHPKFDDLFEAVGLGVRIVGHTKLAILGDNSDLPEFYKEFRRQSDAFWRPAFAAMHASRQSPAAVV